MKPSARLYLCAHCRRQVVICSHCDRGQRYCGARCARTARITSLRAGGRRYQNSRRGRHRHAERQRRYRQRQAEKVTHQGSPERAADGSLLSRPHQHPTAPRVSVIPAGDSIICHFCCHFCARVCSRFVRLGFKRRRSTRRVVSL